MNLAVDAEHDVFMYCSLFAFVCTKFVGGLLAFLPTGIDINLACVLPSISAAAHPVGADAASASFLPDMIFTIVYL